MDGLHHGQSEVAGTANTEAARRLWKTCTKGGEVDMKPRTKKRLLVRWTALADDAEFLRRVYLDLVGVIPPVEKVKAFLESKDANKRPKVVEELLSDSRFGKSLAEVWVNVMIPRDSANRRLTAEPLQEWMS